MGSTRVPDTLRAQDYGDLIGSYKAARIPKSRWLILEMPYSRVRVGSCEFSGDETRKKVLGPKN